MPQHRNSRWRLTSTAIAGLTAASVLSAAGFIPELQREAAAQSLPAFLKRDKEKSGRTQPEIARPVAPNEVGRQQVRMNFAAANWDDVLKKVAADCGSTLVMDKVPKGRFTRTDLKRYSRTDALRMLNDELEKQDYRVVDQGNFLVVLYLPAARPDYRRPAVESDERATQDAGDQRSEISNLKSQISDLRSQNSALTADAPNQKSKIENQKSLPPRPLVGPRRDPGLRTAAFQDDDKEKGTAQAAANIKPFKPTNKTARALSSLLFDAFRDRAEVIESGPEGLPSIRVYAVTPPGANNAQRPILFTIGVDMRSNELLVEGSGEQTERIVRLLQVLDAAPKTGDESTRLVSTKKGATDVAKNVQAAVQRLVAQNDGKGEPPTEKTQINRKDENGKDLPDQVGGIRSDVNVEAMEDLNLIILKGNLADVDAVMAIIKQIEELSAATSPDIHVRTLKYIDSAALSDLLTTVYEKLKEARGKKSDQIGGVTVIAVVKPNAVLVLASERELDGVLDLITQLDKPVAPQTGFAVFSLKHAVAAQVEQLISDFYTRTNSDTKGLATRVRIIADIRTNSIVVLAQPNDLKEIAALIPKIDKSESGSVSQVQMFSLKHAVADDMAQTLNVILQGVLNPAQLGQGQLGQAALGFGGGNSTQQLKEVRSVVLEFLSADGAAQQKYRSGILADIRAHGDNRSNTLVITAPQESMDLIGELIRRLDRPASNTAEIKHYPLRNADAGSVVTLLNQLFTSTTQQGGNQGQGQGQNNQQQSAGIQLAAAEDATSVVPLKFSVDVRTNSIVAIGIAEQLSVVEALILRLDESDIRERKTKVFRLKNTEALLVAQAVQQFITADLAVFQQQGGGGGQQQGQLLSAYERLERTSVIQAEQQTNSVLISASTRYFDDLVKMVESLDEDLPQVVIQALIVEVTLDDADEFGIELGFQDPVLFRRSAGILSAGSALTPGYAFPGAAPGNSNNPSGSPAHIGSQGFADFSVGRTNSDLGFGGLVLSAGSDSVNVLLRALASHRKVEVLSRPQIRTLHNRLGSIDVAQQVPIINGFSQSGLGTNVPNVAYAKAGIVLNVTPKIGADGKIQMLVNAEKTTLDRAGVTIQAATATTGAVTSPIIAGTVAQATITVSDQETVVLGGLITKQHDQIERKVPWLGDIPILGHAFRYEFERTQRTELLIFLTPHLVRNSRDSEATKVIEASRLHWTECEAEEVHGPIFGLPPEMVSPLVPYNQFDSLVQPPAPARLAPPPVEGVPMSRISRDRGGIQQVSYEEPAKPVRLPERKPSSEPAASVGRTSMGAKRPTVEGKNSQR